MTRRVCMHGALAGLLVAAVAAQMASVVAGASSQAGLDASAPAPWIGEWQLDPARSTARAEPSPYKRTRIRIEPWGDGLRVSYDMVGVRGGVTHLEWTGRFDGRDYPVQGLDSVLTNAYRPLDARGYEIIVKLEGQPVAASIARVAPDGQTLTVETTERAPDGRTVRTTAVYARLD